MGNSNTINVSQSSLIKSNKYLKEDSIEDVQQIFAKLQKQQNTKVINRKTFGTLFRYPPEIIDSIFDEFDADSNGTIDSDEFLRGVALCSSGDLSSKIRFCFDAYDASGDGFLQKEELEGLVLSTTFSSFALLDSVGRSMDIAAQQSKMSKGKSPDRPMDRLMKKAAFKKEVNWMVSEAYKSCDTNDDNKLNYEEFFGWVTRTPQIMEVLYGTFQLRNEAISPASPKSNKSRKQLKSTSQTRGPSVTTERSSSLFRSSNGGGSKISPSPSPTASPEPELQIEEFKEVNQKNNDGNNNQEGTEEKQEINISKDESKDESGSTTLVGLQNETRKLRNIWRTRGNVTFVISMFGLFCMVLERLVLHHGYNDQPNAFTTTMR